MEQHNRSIFSSYKNIIPISSLTRSPSVTSEDSKVTSLIPDRSPFPRLSSLLNFSGNTTLNGDRATLDQLGSTIEHQWNAILDNWDVYSKKRGVLLELLHRGVPQQFRSLAWQRCSGAWTSNLKDDYPQYIERASPCERIIKRDISRTFPYHPMFKEKDGPGQMSLFKVIKAYSLLDREVGYCQGSAFVVGLLLMQMPEEEAFATLAQLMYAYNLRELYRPDMAMLGVRMYQLDGLIEDVSPSLALHFAQHQFSSSLYASPWFLTLFSTSFNVEFSIRVLDLFMAEGVEIIFKLALAILKMNESILTTMDMESMLIFLQNDVSKSLVDPGYFRDVFELAASLKLNQKTMKRLEKDYLTRLSQEREEQTELRRLRTELSLLKQQVSHLEQDNKVITEQLVNSKISRAQDGEVILSLRNQLARVTSEMSSMKDINQNNNNNTSNSSEDDALSTSSGYNIPGISNYSPDDRLTHPCSSELNNNAFFVSNNVEESSDCLKGRDAIVDLRIAKAKIALLEEQLQDMNCEKERRCANLEAELVAVKSREANSLMRADEYERRMSELEQLWLTVASSGLSVSPSKPSQVAKMSDRIAEAKLLSRIAELEREQTETRSRHEMNQSQIMLLTERLNRLEQRLSTYKADKTQLLTDVRVAESKAASLESKDKSEEFTAKRADQIFWRIREMELITQLAEERQMTAQLECRIEEISMNEKLYVNGHGLSETASLGEMSLTQFYRELKRDDRNVDSITPIETGTSTPQMSLKNCIANLSYTTVSVELQSDREAPISKPKIHGVPSSIMTESIGPIEELCVLPNDPLITSIYVAHNTDCSDYASSKKNRSISPADRDQVENNNKNE